MARRKAVPEVEVLPDAAVVREALGTSGTQGTQRPPCLCGCDGTPKGPKSRFIPGHDSRYHSAQKKAQVQP